MRAAVLHHKHNDPIRYQEWPDPIPSDSQVVVKIQAAALNRNDAMIVADRGSLAGPTVIGFDGAGVVAAVGAGLAADTAPQVGQEMVILPSLYWGDSETAQGPEFEILGLPTPGTQAEYVAVPAENVFTKPAGLDWVQAAALPLAGLTAWRALVTKGQLQEADRVLVTGGSGGVATFLVQIASALGAEVWVTSSRTESIERSVSLGACGGAVRSTDWAAELLSAGDRPFDLVVDSSGTDWTALLSLLRPGGRLVSLGRTGCREATLDVLGLFAPQLSIHGTLMGSPREFGALLAHLEQHSWRPVVDSIHPLSDVPQAYDRLDSPSRFGKVVLSVAAD